MKKNKIVFLLAVVFPLSTLASVIHVPGDQPTIQAGIDAAVNGDTVLVADGTYTGDGNRDIDFGGKAITVRSENGAENCIIDCQGSESDPHRGFYFHNGEGTDSVVQGFTIQRGYAAGEWPDIYGGGIFCYRASPTIAENIIGDPAPVPLLGNVAESWGGGICCHTDSSPNIINNTIRGNTGNPAGGVYCFSTTSVPVISGNDISNNKYNGIGCNGAPSYILNNTITENYLHGIACGAGYKSVTIVGNIISGNGNIGISADFYSHLIRDNIIDENGDHGIVVGGDSLTEISGNCIASNHFRGILCGRGSTVIIKNNRITGNGHTGTYFQGGGIYCNSGSLPEITDNIIKGNKADFGGGIYTSSDATVISNNIISDNSAEEYGGGIFFSGIYNRPIINNIISNNSAERGGGLYIYAALTVIKFNTIVGNTAAVRGGGLYLYNGDLTNISNSILCNNNAPDGKEVYINGYTSPSGLTISYSLVEGGLSSVHVESGATLNWGDGMIDADPLFLDGAGGGHYLSQIAAGQMEDSPCVDAGDPASDMLTGTTRTDAVQDAGIVDMGFHYPTAKPYLLAGPGPAYANPPTVRLLPTDEGGSCQYEFKAYGASRYGVNVSCGDIDGESLDEIITGPGPGAIYGPYVRGFQVSGTPISGLSFLAYGTRKWGVNVAAGELDNDGFDEIITGPGPGAVFGPHVRAFDFDGGPTVTPVPGVSYFAYGTRKWGVNVSRGDIDGDGFDEIITGAGAGPVFGPHVRGWDVDGGTASAMPAVSYFAYSTRKWGVGVASGNVDGDGFDEIVTAPGPSWYFGTHIRGWNYDNASISSLPGFSYFAWPSAEARHGAKVFSGADLNEDSRDELVAGCGPDPSVGSPVKVFLYDGTQVTEWFSLQAFPSGWTHGANVAAGRF